MLLAVLVVLVVLVVLKALTMPQLLQLLVVVQRIAQQIIKGCCCCWEASLLWKHQRQRNIRTRGSCKR